MQQLISFRIEQQNLPHNYIKIQDIKDNYDYIMLRHQEYLIWFDSSSKGHFDL